MSGQSVAKAGSAMQTNIGPRDFYEMFVYPAIAQWRANPADIRLATIAICELDNLAERFILFENPAIDRAGLTCARDALCNSKHYLAMARDVHDTHKHGRLSRKSARIRLGQIPRVERFGGLSSSPLSAAPLSGGGEYLVVVLDDGTIQNIDVVITHCLRHWNDEFLRLGV